MDPRFSFNESSEDASRFISIDLNASLCPLTVDISVHLIEQTRSLFLNESLNGDGIGHHFFVIVFRSILRKLDSIDFRYEGCNDSLGVTFADTQLLCAVSGGVAVDVLFHTRSSLKGIIRCSKGLKIKFRGNEFLDHALQYKVVVNSVFRRHFISPYFLSDAYSSGCSLMNTIFSCRLNLSYFSFVMMVLFPP